MSNLSARRRIWTAILGATSIGALLTWLGYIAAFERFDATRPAKPDVESGRTIPQNNHGHIVYLTGYELERLVVLQNTSIGLFLLAAVAAYVATKKKA